MSAASQEADDPRAVLAHTRDLTRRVRMAQRTTWVALLVLAVVVLAAIPLYRYARYGIGSAHCAASADGRLNVCLPYSTLVLWYWPGALVAAYAVIGAVFVRRARARGVGSRVTAYVIGGVVLALAAAGVSLWDSARPLSWAQVAGTFVPVGSSWVPELNRLVGPTGVIGLGLLVLARVERSRALVLFALVYLYSVMASVPAGQRSAATSSSWIFLPGLLLPGLVLLVGSGLFAVLDRRRAGAL